MLKKRQRVPQKVTKLQKVAVSTINQIQNLRESLVDLQKVLVDDSSVEQSSSDASQDKSQIESDIVDSDESSPFEGRKKVRIHEEMFQLITESPNQISFGCILCDMSFQKKWQLTKHQKRSHQPLVQCKFQKIEGGFNCKVCQEFLPNRLELNLHVWQQHFQDRVDLFYKAQAKVLVPKSVKSNCLELLLKQWKLITQGIDQGALKLDVCAHKSDIEWLFNSDFGNELKEMQGIFQEEYLKPLQNLWMRINFHEGEFYDLHEAGRQMTQAQGWITVTYPLSDYYGQNIDKMDDSIVREISTLEALKFNLREIFPTSYQLQKSYKAIYIQFKVNGKSLRSIIDDKKMLQIHGIQIFRLLLDAVKYMAKRGYAHRNICPDNIYISSDFQSIQLVGFDKACFRDRKERQMTGCERPYWQPMDKWWSQSTFRWDMMQASIVFYECMETKAFFYFFKECHEMNKCLQISRRFHQFTKLHDLMYGLMTYGEIPTLTHPNMYIKNILDDSVLEEFEGGLKAFNLSKVYEPQRDNISELMHQQPHWSHV